MPEESATSSPISEELKKLIQDEGLTPWRLEVLGPTIMNVVGASNGHEAREVIRPLLQGSDDYTVALRHALGLHKGNEGRTLTQRRAQLLKYHGYTNVSEATLRRYESKAISALVRKLEAMNSEAVQLPTNPTADAINRLCDALVEHTAVLRQVNENLKRLAH